MGTCKRTLLSFRSHPPSSLDRFKLFIEKASSVNKLELELRQLHRNSSQFYFSISNEKFSMFEIDTKRRRRSQTIINDVLLRFIAIRLRSLRKKSSFWFDYFGIFLFHDFSRSSSSSSSSFFIITIIIIRYHTQSSLHWSHISNEISIHSFLLMRFRYRLCFFLSFCLQVSVSYWQRQSQFFSLIVRQRQTVEHKKQRQRTENLSQKLDHNRELCQNWCYQISFRSHKRHIKSSFSSLTNSDLISWKDKKEKKVS